MGMGEGGVYAGVGVVGIPSGRGIGLVFDIACGGC